MSMVGEGNIAPDPMADTSLTIVGAGVVGLAVAARLAPSHPDLVILERRERHGQETSSRNSEVIHAGMYYPTGSLKARLCVEGNRRLYALADRHRVPHRRTAKLIVATVPEETSALEGILAQGRANGVDLEMLSGADARRLEPNVAAVAALFSPNTGIVSAHALMDHFLHEAREHGATLQPRAKVVALERRTSDYRVTIHSGQDVESFTSERVINAAGLGADTVAALAGIDVDAAGYHLHYVKGSYFSASAAASKLTARLIYPVPGHVSLGTHAVVGLEGRLRFGPDAEYLPDRVLDYRVDESRRGAFGEAVRRLMPAVRDEDLSPDIAGIRPKLQGPGEGFRDFVIAKEDGHGLPGLVSLVGIDSPGLTSAPAIAEHVAALLEG
jgi:L-2-hydroxyglutarate oxidase LhgO